MFFIQLFILAEEMSTSRNPVLSSRLYGNNPIPEVATDRSGKEMSLSQREDYLKDQETPTEFSRRKRHRQSRQGNRLIQNQERSDNV